MFNTRRSHIIDSVVMLLELHPPLVVRLVLRVYKYMLERGI